MCMVVVLVFFFNQKTAYELRISDWSSDVCSSDLLSAPEMAELPSRSAKSGAAITVVVPPVPVALQSPRIPVKLRATEYAWLSEGQWVEAPNGLFPRQSADELHARTKMVDLDTRQTTHDHIQPLTAQHVALR